MVIKKMKTIEERKTIIVNVEVPVYLASNGKAFDNEVAANLYEKRLEIKKQIENIPYKRNTFGLEEVDTSCSAYYCSTEEEVRKVFYYVTGNDNISFPNDIWQGEDWYFFNVFDCGDNPEEIEVNTLKRMRAATNKFFAFFEEEV